MIWMLKNFDLPMLLHIKARMEAAEFLSEFIKNKVSKIHLTIFFWFHG